MKKVTSCLINECVTAFYENNLKGNDYFKERGLDQKTIYKFRLGYAPDSFNETHKYLIEAGYKMSEIKDAGLVANSEKTGSNYDVFRNRMMFPICNETNIVIGFGGRACEKDNLCKYLNSSDSLVYQKSSSIYGLNHAVREIIVNNEVIIVEGYMDVISAHQAGTKNVIASSGTSLTKEQIEKLSHYTKNFVLCFDNDVAGIKATERAIDMILESGNKVEVMKIMHGKDPDECIKFAGYAWEETLRNRISIIDFIKSLENTGRTRKEIVEKIANMIATYPDVSSLLK